MARRVLLIGSGGREHALAWKLKNSPTLGALFAFPGSDAISALATCLDAGLTNQRLIEEAKSLEIDLVVIGPEAPLCSGLSDQLRAAGFAVFGPNSDGAVLEGSKSFTKELCQEWGIPTAQAATFTDAAAAKTFAETLGLPVVIKADGLAAGKGVVIAETRQEADDAIDTMLSGQFGSASETLLIEEFLDGEEISVFAITDGETAHLSPAIQDHKRAFDGDKGPNTGGMGTYGPAPQGSKPVMDAIERTIIQPTLKALKARGIQYQGVLFAGLMLTENGPKLIEYNVRFGDPECQVLMALLDDDLVQIMAGAATQTLGDNPISWNGQPTLCVVMAGKGYPGSPQKGDVINGLDAAKSLDGISVYEAGTLHQNGKVIANGGRVLNIVATADSFTQAQERAFNACDTIDWAGGFFRKDIGFRVIQQEIGKTLPLDSESADRE